MSARAGITGECRRCGACCVEAWRFSHNVPKDPGDGNRYRWEEAAVAIKTTGEGEPCRALAFDPETGLAVCTFHGPEKQEVCQRYPTTPTEILFSTCGFRPLGEFQDD